MAVVVEELPPISQVIGDLGSIAILNAIELFRMGYFYAISELSLVLRVFSAQGFILKSRRF